MCILVPGVSSRRYLPRFRSTGQYRGVGNHGSLGSRSTFPFEEHDQANSRRRSTGLCVGSHEDAEGEETVDKDRSRSPMSGEIPPQFERLE